MTEKFIKYKYITAAGGKENGRNRSYRYFNYICGRPYPYCRAGSGSESLNIIKNVIYIVGVFIGSICLWVSFDWSELTDLNVSYILFCLLCNNRWLAGPIRKKRQEETPKTEI